MRKRGVVRLVMAALALGGFGVGAVGCRGQSDGNFKGAKQVVTRPIDAVLLDHTNEIMALQGVVGIYQGETDAGKPCIKVMVIEATHELAEKIPTQLEGYPVVIEATGEIRPMPKKSG